jgi:YaiO family outer membrane protein
MKNQFKCTALLGLLISFLQAHSQIIDSSKNEVSLRYDYFHFNKAFAGNWQIASLEYKRQAALGTALGRINYGDRLGRQGWQGEIEAYPRFSKKTYGYISVGYSPDAPVFPKFRSGASLYVGLKAWEVEGGFRQLYFDKSVWIGTAGLSKYIGAWLFTVRSFLSQTSSGTDQSYFFTTRRYFGERNNYLWLQVGSGISPDENRNVLLKGDGKLSSKRITTGINYFPAARHRILASFGYSRDEYTPNGYSNQFFGNVGYGIAF